MGILPYRYLVSSGGALNRMRGAVALHPLFIFGHLGYFWLTLAIQLPGRDGV
jgi:hypothetical protein